jgi:competence protein ComFC
MAVVDTNPTRIDGPWVEGFVLDRHVISSYPIGYIGDHMQFDTTRSALGELIYQLKYRNGGIDDIVDTAAAFVTEHWPGGIDSIVVPPPSLHRARQPMRTIADGLAARLGIPVLADAVVKATATQQMKNVPLDERGPLLAAAIQAGPESVQDRRVLVADDLWETGNTLRRVAEILTAKGSAEIRALVMTRTK